MYTICYTKSMNNYKITVQYNGKNYSGWQIQDGKDTIEGRLSIAIKAVTGKDIKVVGSGRTDAGVSAIAQVANFLLDADWDCQKLIKAINAHLPNDIAVLDVQLAEEDFNARFSAKTKTYNYYFYVSSERNPILDQFALQVKYAEIFNMQSACKYLIGTKDYKSFVARNSGKTDFTRTIYSAEINQVKDNLYVFEICGNGFLYNMVRIIMGTLISVGEGKITPIDIQNIIKSKDRTKAGKTVPAVGLMLKCVSYK